MPARSVTGNQATAARTAGPVSAASSARWPPAESPHRHTRSASSPYAAPWSRIQPTAAQTSSSGAGKRASPLSR